MDGNQQQHAVTQDPITASVRDVPTSTESPEPPSGSGRRKLAISIILLMMGAIVVDMTVFTAGDGDQEPSTAMDEFEDIDALLADMTGEKGSSPASDQLSDGRSASFDSQRNSGNSVPSSSLLQPESSGSAFSLTIPSDGNLAASNGAPMHSASWPEQAPAASTPRPSNHRQLASAQPAIHFTGTIQPTQQQR